MSFSGRGTKELQSELKWVTLTDEDDTFQRKMKSRGISGVCVIAGMVATVGVLATGVYYMYRRDSKKQQAFMRYRVLAQGLTLAIATAGLLGFKSE